MTGRLSFTFTQLESLVAAADAGNMTTAATAIHTSQSNLSVAIGKLERQLGTELLVRHRTKGVSVTPGGREVVSRARVILRLACELQEWSREDSTALRGDLRIGSFLPLTPFYIPGLLNGIRTHAPQLTTSIHEDTLDVLQELVRSTELDVALTYDQEMPPDLEFTEIAVAASYVIVSRTSRFADAESVSLSDLTDEPMIVYDLPFTIDRGRWIFDVHGLPRPPEQSATTVDTMRAMVGADLGFAILHQRWPTNLTAGGTEVVPLEIIDDIAPLRVGTMARPENRAARVRLVTTLLRGMRSPSP